MGLRLSRVSFHPAFYDDLRAATTFYANVDRSLPARLREILRKKVRLIRQHPSIGGPLDEPFRRVFIPPFPYMIVYRVADGVVRVLALLDARRDPEWIRATIQGREPR